MPDYGKVEVARGPNLKGTKSKWPKETRLRTFRAKDPNCFVQLYGDDHLDVSSITIWEGFQDDEDSVLTLLDPYFYGTLQLKRLIYRSCTSRVAVGIWASQDRPLWYRQVCPKDLRTQEGSSVLQAHHIGGQKGVADVHDQWPKTQP